MASERRSVWKIYRQICTYQSGLWTCGRDFRRLLRRHGRVVAEQTVDEETEADDDQEPADPDGFALDTDEPQERHQAEPHGHHHHAARSKTGSGTNRLDPIHRVHAAFEAIGIGFR